MKHYMIIHYVKTQKPDMSPLVDVYETFCGTYRFDVPGYISRIRMSSLPRKKIRVIFEECDESRQCLS